MARKSLSSQVIEEVARVQEILQGAQGLLDPMSAHMIETALQGLHRVETLCLRARQADVNAVLTATPAKTGPVDAVVDVGTGRPPAAAPARRRAPRKAVS